MNIWHDTDDAPRTPRRVSPSQGMEVIIGTWPIGPGQSVWVTWNAISLDGSRTEGTNAAQWQRNTDVNSYWTARLGPFADGDQVTYTVHGSSADGAVQTNPFAVRIRPALYVAWLWHQHQPLYRDPAASGRSGSYRYPWVRLHAIRDYYSMAALAAEHDVHVTFNLTPVLLRQIDDYLQNGATDSALELTLRPAEKLTKAQVEEVLSTFFDADWHQVSAEAVEMIGHHGITWLATDAGVLARSGQWGYRASEPDVLCQPYRASDEATPLALFFRDTELSDRIGFQYGQFTDAPAAVRDFVRTIETRFLDRLYDDEDRVLTIVLDGENAWGGYADDGRPFLHALYSRLASDPRLKTVTFSEYLLGNAARGIAAHPVSGLTRVHDLATGSWIDEPGSAPGVDLGTWIGEPEENAAWNLLGMARSAFANAASDGPAVERAREALYAAEGSDWYWQFGSDQESRNDAAFDELFRAHLRGVYQELDLEAPESLDDFIVAHPVVWTFTRPVARTRPRDRVSIRTNCPGRLTYRIDHTPEQVAALVPVGGVMAGARRFQITLGPFPAPAHRLLFRFYCEHPGCQHESPCCLSGPQAITLDRIPPRTPHKASVDSSTAQSGGNHADCH